MAKNLDAITDPDAPGAPLADVAATQAKAAKPAKAVAAAPLPGLKLATEPLFPEEQTAKVLPRYPFEVRITLDANEYSFNVNAIDPADAINQVFTEHEALRVKYTRCRSRAKQLSDKPVNT